MRNNARHLKTTRNYDGATQDILLSTDRENQQRCTLGAGNCIIIGTSSYDNTFIAYEGQCPNCLNQYGGTRYPLSWQNNGTVVSDGGGHQLYRYNAGFDGQMIRAWN